MRASPPLALERVRLLVVDRLRLLVDRLLLLFARPRPLLEALRLLPLLRLLEPPEPLRLLEPLEPLRLPEPLRLLPLLPLAELRVLRRPLLCLDLLLEPDPPEPPLLACGMLSPSVAEKAVPGPYMSGRVDGRNSPGVRPTPPPSRPAADRALRSPSARPHPVLRRGSDR
jgi:hypothetical protein